jgi:hypothetical protein
MNLAPEQEMLKQAALTSNEGPWTSPQFSALATPTAILAILAQLEAAERVSTLPSTPLPGTARQGDEQAKTGAFVKWAETFYRNQAEYTPHEYDHGLNAWKAAIEWLSSLQQPVQAVPDRITEYLMSQLRSIADLEPVEAMLDPQWASRIAKFALATVAAKSAPGEPGQ